MGNTMHAAKRLHIIIHVLLPIFGVQSLIFKPRISFKGLFEALEYFRNLSTNINTRAEAPSINVTK